MVAREPERRSAILAGPMYGSETGPAFASDSAESGPSSPAATNERVGKYRLAFRLASGGMGTVYLARVEGARGFSQTVAVKRIHPHLADDPKFVAMFLDEARIAARIQHPNVCGVIDFGEANGSYYFTMPYLAGESLSRVMRAVYATGEHVDRFTYVATRIACDACEGLHAAHELAGDDGRPLSVVHRDVSPQNLLVGFDGAVRVLDFGVASAEQRLHSTTTGEVKGKFAYIAPEQLNGRAVDRRADIWSLGVVLWECLAGRKLFARKNVNDTVRAVLGDAVPSLREIRAGVPLGLEEIVFRALSRDPEARYASAREMGRDLNAFLLEERRSVTAADVAELMTALFPGGAEDKRKLVERARDSDVEIVARERATEPVTVAKRRAPRRTVLFVVIALLAGSALTVGLMKLLETGGPPVSDRSTAGEPVLGDATEIDVPETGVPETGRPSGEQATGVVHGSGGGTRDGETSAEDDGPPPDDRAREDGEPPRESDPGADRDPGDESGDDSQEPPDERREPARAPGRIQIATPGGWGVAYDGRRRLGEVPGSFSLSPGRHTIAIAPRGRGTKIRRVVHVRSGATTSVSIPVRSD
jgi:hypothetical protein